MALDTAPKAIAELDYRNKSSDVEWTELHPAEQVSVRDTLHGFAIQPNVPAPADEIQLRRGLPAIYEAIPIDLLRLEDAWLETSMCVAITADHEYVVNTLRSVRQAEELGYERPGPHEFTLPECDQVLEHHGPALLVGLPAGKNYFHWMIEAITRWLFGSQHIPENAKLIVPEVGRMEYSALQAAGVPADRLLTVPRAALLQVKELFVVTRGMRGSDEIQPAATRKLRDLAAPRSDATHRRLFISRASARRRRIGNESEVIDVATRHGFEPVHPDKLTVAEQIDLFANADAILGFHGAGLTNAVFAPAGSALVELQPPGLDKSRVVLYWNQAATCNQAYTQIICPEGPRQADLPSDRDITVHTGHLDGLLHTILPPPI